MSVPASHHSALTSLTATYTDSEEETDSGDENEIMENDENSFVSSVKEIEKPKDLQQESNSNGSGVLTVVKNNKSRIPPEPPGKCSPELQQKISKLYQRKLEGGLDMNSIIEQNKQFRNPSIYEKLVKYCDIDEIGSNFPKHIFDPHGWHESSFYEELSKAQNEMMEKRAQNRKVKEKTDVNSVSTTGKRASMLPIPTELDPKRKSKWEQRSVTASAPAEQSQPTLAISAPSTIINAFGNIKKL